MVSFTSLFAHQRTDCEVTTWTGNYCYSTLKTPGVLILVLLIKFQYGYSNVSLSSRYLFEMAPPCYDQLYIYIAFSFLLGLCLPCTLPLLQGRVGITGTLICQNTAEYFSTWMPLTLLTAHPFPCSTFTLLLSSL